MGISGDLDESVGELLNFLTLPPPLLVDDFWFAMLVRRFFRSETSFTLATEFFATAACRARTNAIASETRSRVGARSGPEDGMFCEGVLERPADAPSSWWEDGRGGGGGGGGGWIWETTVMVESTN